MTVLSFFALLSYILAFIQIIFLPGWLALHFFKIDGSFLRKLIIGFALSLMINYWLLFICASYHIYTILALLIILVIEISLFLYIYRNSFKEFKAQTLNSFSSNWLEKIKYFLDRISAFFNKEFLDENGKSFKLTILILSAGTFAYLGYLFIDNIGTIFQLWDPIVSWNRWAVEWSMNAIPKNTWEYPQLIPMNWSVFYVLVGEPMQYLPKMIMPLFPLAIALTFLSEGIRKKSWGYIAAIPALILLMRLLNGSAIMATEGYVDTAVAFFSTLSVMCLLRSDGSDSNLKIMQTLFIGSLMAIGAAMTKQAGLFIAIIYPFLAWFIIIRKNTELKRNAIKYTLFYVCFILLLLGPFYIYKEISISSHSDVSIVPTISKMVYGSGKDHALAVLEALRYLVTKTHGLILLYLFFSIYACRDRKNRYIVCLVTIPYAIIWALFFSYDTRNLTLAMPLLGLAAGIGLEQFCILGKNRFSESFSRIKLIYCCTVLLLIILVISPWVSKKIIARHTQDERSMYDSELSILITNYFESHPDDGKIFSDFPMLYFLPATKDRIYSPYDGYSPNRNDFDDYSEDNSKPEAAFILAANYTDKIILHDIENKITDGQFSLIFRHNGFVLIKTNNK